jgi:hypothetical protein
VIQFKATLPRPPQLAGSIGTTRLLRAESLEEVE